jgi:hypothetical protein
LPPTGKPLVSIWKRDSRKFELAEPLKSSRQKAIAPCRDLVLKNLIGDDPQKAIHIVERIAAGGWRNPARLFKASF